MCCSCLTHTESCQHVTVYTSPSGHKASSRQRNTNVLTWKSTCSSTATKGVQGGGEGGEQAREPRTLESPTSVPSPVSFISWRAVLKVSLAQQSNGVECPSSVQDSGRETEEPGPPSHVTVTTESSASMTPRGRRRPGSQHTALSHWSPLNRDPIPP